MSDNDLRATTFAELIRDGLLEIGDGYRAKNEELGGDGPIFLRAGHVTDSHIDFDGVERFHASLTERIAPKMSRPGDTIVTTKGNSTGRTSFVTARMPAFVYSPHLSYWRSRDDSRLANGFLRYWSQSVEFVKQLAGMKASTDMAPYLSLTDQRRLKITLPPFAEQQAIACILGALDDKIELNRRMNRTLEGIARAVFKSWFVDFDPVRAKARVRREHPDWSDAQLNHTACPHFSPDLAAFFPDAFQDSELGEIPQGWNVRTVADLCEFAYGKALKANIRTPGPFPVMGSNGQVGTHNEALAKGPGIVIGRKGNPGVVTWIHSDFFPIDTTFYVARRDEGCPFTYLFYALAALDLENLGADSAVPGLNRNIAYGSKLLRPDTELLRRFDRIVSSIWNKHRAAEIESRTLAALRDALLPKLISGELRITDAERIVGRAG